MSRRFRVMPCFFRRRACDCLLETNDPIGMPERSRQSNREPCPADIFEVHRKSEYAVSDLPNPSELPRALTEKDSEDRRHSSDLPNLSELPRALKARTPRPPVPSSNRRYILRAPPYSRPAKQNACSIRTGHSNLRERDLGGVPHNSAPHHKSIHPNALCVSSDDGGDDDDGLTNDVLHHSDGDHGGRDDDGVT